MQCGGCHFRSASTSRASGCPRRCSCASCYTETVIIILIIIIIIIDNQSKRLPLVLHMKLPKTTWRHKWHFGVKGTPSASMPCSTRFIVSMRSLQSRTISL